MGSFALRTGALALQAAPGQLSELWILTGAVVVLLAGIGLFYRASPVDRAVVLPIPGLS